MNSVTVAGCPLDIRIHTLLIAVALFAPELTDAIQVVDSAGVLVRWCLPFSQDHGLLLGSGGKSLLCTQGLQRVFRVGPTFHQEKGVLASVTV